MSRWQQAFFLLLRAGLWEKPVADLSLFPLSGQEWQQVCEESRRQTVQGLIYRGFQLLPEPLFPPQDILLKWLTDIDAIETANRLMLHAIGTSERLIRQGGVRCVLQKGMTAALLYEHPELRSCGDIDWYVVADGSRWQSLLSFLHSRGLCPMITADGSICFTYENVEIELHQRLIDIQHPRKQKVLIPLSGEETFVQLQLSDSVSVTTTPPLTTMILFMAHIMKHALTIGIGLRQFCDLARAYHIWQGQYDMTLLTDYYQQLGMGKWSTSVHALLTEYLGLAADELPAALPARSHAAWLMDHVVRWGNFGQHTSQWPGHPSKRYTIGQILRNMSLSLRYAPAESFYRIKGLVKGQVRSDK